MLFTLGHGQHVFVEGETRSLGAVTDAVPLAAVKDAAGSDGRAAGLTAPPAIGGPFGYYFDRAPEAPHAADTATRLDALADAMVEASTAPESEAQNSDIPPVFTYLGQFIDHDITANTDRETGPSIIDGPGLTPIPRSNVVQQLVNLRSGFLELDSLYGDASGQGAFAQKLARLMRHPTLKGKMRLGVATATDGNRPPLPADPAADLLRLGRLIGAGVTLAELQALPPALQGNFLKAGQPIVQKAIIGDARNDENLIVAQLHCAFLRLHNKVVDTSPAGGSASSDATFEAARKLVRWHYQWLIVNAYLPTVCDPATVDRVKAAEAPLYAAFHARSASAGQRQMPLPLEFSVAAFRFGHSMVRGAYDHNRFFGRSEDGSPTIIPRAPFVQLFNFTGNGDPPMSPGGTTPSAPTLPNNWIIEWDRFVESNPALTDRGARKIDTRLAFPLSDLKNEPSGLFKHLARRNLRRGHRLNLPAAQDCIAALAGVYGPAGGGAVEPLSEAVLTSGATGAAVSDGGFLRKTPLWFYVLKEAEAAGGEHLGALGSTLVAETLIGLVVKDPSSYWHQPGSDAGRWHPRDGAKPDGRTVDSVAAMLAAVGLLTP